MWKPGHYCWVVYCKNRLFHIRHDIVFRHKIPLGITDDLAPCPAINDSFPVKCDECGEEYLYRVSEVRRSELEVPETFTPHPSFW